MSALLQHIEHEGREISQKVLDEQYRDPFWTERYGDRGRHHADEDSDFHLRYLSRALAADDAGVLRRYAVWLREVLATRGMCTRHLDENFRLLSREIAARPWPDRERAVAFLGEAREALAYQDADAASLQSNAEVLGAAVARAFHEERPAGWKRDARGDGGLRDDAASYVSYIADALAFGKPDTLIAHTRWLKAHVQSHGASAEDVAAFLVCVRQAIAPHGPATLSFFEEAVARS
jgi:hypothetical protein